MALVFSSRSVSGEKLNSCPKTIALFRGCTGFSFTAPHKVFTEGKRQAVGDALTLPEIVSVGCALGSWRAGAI